ncbi:uncharacterized protein LOC144436330 [Glandiceps talaboti]
MSELEDKAALVHQDALAGQHDAIPYQHDAIPYQQDQPSQPQTPALLPPPTYYQAYHGGQVPIDTPPVQVIRPQVYGSVPYVQPLENPPKDYLVLSILMTIFCSWPIGIVAIIKSIDVRNAIQTGDHERAERASVTAKKLNIAAAIVGIVANILLIVVMVIAVTA